jgi:hypothetical protein
MELKYLTQQSECAGAEPGCLRILSECLGDSSMRIGVPFIAPRQLGAVGGHLEGQTCLLSGGAPDSPVHHRTVTVVVRCAISFLFSGASDRWSWGAVGAPDTVWCPLPTVGASHTSPADCAADRCAGDRWLTGQSGAPPDSPVNYSRMPQIFSRERPFHWRLAWRTGHCPVHHRTVWCARLS